jgi:outer membrane lipoprotein-sorting protein
MTSSFLRRLLGGLALASLWAVSTAAAAFELPQLMSLLASVPAGEATFVEKRQVREFDQVLESSGRLSFTAPHVFVRETLKPRPEKLAVNGNTLVMSRGSRSRTVQLDAVPEAQVMVEAIRGTLTGNREVLERHFTVQLSGNASRWSLVLAPKDRRLRDQVSSIQVNGRESALDEVLLELPGGDRSVMSITSVPASPRPGS